jgi:pimeloyl-ACP methyl ester carboxylesterase
VALFHEITGGGPDVVLVHQGIADSRVWDAQWTSFADRYRVVRADLPGFGRSPIEHEPFGCARELADLLDALGIEGAGVVGGSLGGRVSLELAIGRPELVGALVLVAPGLPGFDWSAEVRASWEAEEEAVTRGDLDGATEVNMRLWVDGPRRQPGDVDAAVRTAVAGMQRRALELQVPHWEGPDEDMLVPDVAERLGEVRAPTLVVVGEEDVEDMQRLARSVAASIPGARLAAIPQTAHVPNLERPAAFDAIVLGFLDEALAA